MMAARYPRPLSGRSPQFRRRLLALPDVAPVPVTQLKTERLSVS